MATTEHLLREFAYTTHTSKQAFETNQEMVETIVLDAALRDMKSKGFEVHSHAVTSTPVMFESEDGSVYVAMEIAVVGLAYRLDESVDQTLRKLAIDGAVRDE